MELTNRQRQVLDHIRTHQQQHGIAPTVREICAHFGLTGPAGIHRILNLLAAKGYLVSTPGKKRSWRLAGGPPRKSVPLVGSIAAGPAITAVENIEDELPVDPSLFGCDDSCFALRIRGDSMKDAHIVDGDLAIIKPVSKVDKGQIGAVLIEEMETEATLKIIHRKRGAIELHAANEAYQPMIFRGKERQKVRIIGKCVGVIRR